MGSKAILPPILLSNSENERFRPWSMRPVYGVLAKGFVFYGDAGI